VSSKYGVPLTDETWTGWPFRVGHFPRRGRIEALAAEADALLIWSGGVSEVTLHARQPHAGSSRARREPVRHHLVRRSGMIDFLPRGTQFDEVSWQGEPSACVSVTLERGHVERLLGETVSRLDSERGFRLGITDTHVLDLVRRLEAQALAGQPLGRLYVEGLSLTLASYVYARYGGNSPPPSDERAKLPLLQSEQLVGFVEDNLGKNIGLTELAALVGYSPDHFARLFKRSFGLSPYQYVLARRVERAKALLRDRTHSIAEVAMAAGFATQAHLNTTFKSRTGMTPGAYRKS